MVALPCGQNRGHIAEQGGILQNAFINYLTQKQAAGIVNVTQPGSTQVRVFFFMFCAFVSMRSKTKRLTMVACKCILVAYDVVQYRTVETVDSVQ